MTRQDLALAGRLMHGTRWQAGLASDLGVTPRLVRFWASGERPLAAWVPGKVEQLVQAHALGLARLSGLKLCCPECGEPLKGVQADCGCGERFFEVS